MGAASRKNSGNDVGKQASFRADTGKNLICQVIKFSPHLPGAGASQVLSASSLEELIEMTNVSGPQCCKATGLQNLADQLYDL